MIKDKLVDKEVQDISMGHITTTSRMVQVSYFRLLNSIVRKRTMSPTYCHEVSHGKRHGKSWGQHYAQQVVCILTILVVVVDIQEDYGIKVKQLLIIANKASKEETVSFIYTPI